MEESIFKGYNDYNLCLYTWDKVEKAKAVVVVLHGLFEHMGRYDYFARALNDNGYIAVGFDMRALGKTAGGKYGLSPQGDCFNNTINDVIMLVKHAKEKYNLPIMIFGFDYGSLVAQRLMECASELFSSVVLSGTLKMPNIKVKFAKILNGVVGMFENDDKLSTAMTQYWYGSLNRQFCKQVKVSNWWSRDVSAVESFNADPLCGKSMSVGFYKNVYKVLGQLYTTKSLSSIRKDLPILILAGDRDIQTNNARQVNKLYDLYTENALGKIELKLYQGARHALLAELNKDEIIEDVIGYYDDKLNKRA